MPFQHGQVELGGGRSFWRCSCEMGILDEVRRELDV